jgi:hypothetical protein
MPDGSSDPNSPKAISTVNLQSGPGANTFTVGDPTGKDNYSGTANLDGEGGADNYVIYQNPQGLNNVINVVDSGNDGAANTLTVYGTPKGTPHTTLQGATVNGNDFLLRAGAGSLAARLTSGVGTTTSMSIQADHAIAPGSIINIDFEKMLVTGSTATGNNTFSLTVQRGVNGSQAVTHLAGADVYLVPARQPAFVAALYNEQLMNGGLVPQHFELINYDSNIGSL